MYTALPDSRKLMSWVLSVVPTVQLSPQHRYQPIRQKTAS
jgi:hypothetical protein